DCFGIHHLKPARSAFQQQVADDARTALTASVDSRSMRSQPHRIFLLSPARVAGIRAGWVLNQNSDSETARRLRQEGVALGELFSFISGLYFRGKLAYARAFADAPPGLHGAFVITSSGGLVPPDTLVTHE